MNLDQLEEKLKSIVAAPDEDEFIYDLLSAYDAPTSFCPGPDLKSHRYKADTKAAERMGSVIQRAQYAGSDKNNWRYQ